MASNRIIIPSGTVGPNESVVIELPRGLPPANNTFVARRLDYPRTPPSFREDYMKYIPTGGGNKSYSPPVIRTTPGAFSSDSSDAGSYRVPIMIRSFEPGNTPSPLRRQNEEYQRYLQTRVTPKQWPSDYYYNSLAEDAQMPGSPQRRVQSTSSINMNRSYNQSGNLSESYIERPPNASYSQDSSQFLPPYASTPNRNNSSSNVWPSFSPTPTSNRADSSSGVWPSFTPTPVSNRADSSSGVWPTFSTTGGSANVSPPRSSTPQRITRKISLTKTHTPSDLSEEYTDEESYADTSMYDSSEDNINDSLMGKIISGEMGRRLVFPTPPGQPPGSGRSVLIEPNMRINETPRSTIRSRLARTVETPNNVTEEIVEEEISEEPSEIFDSSEDRMNDSVLGKVIAGNMGRRLQFPTPPGQPSGSGRVVDLDSLQPNRRFVKFQSNAGYPPAGSSRNTTYDRSRQMNNTFGANRANATFNRSLQESELSYDDFAPAANSSQIDIRGNQTNVNQPNNTYDMSFGNLDQLEAREQDRFEINLREWQSARRKLIFDTTNLSTSNSSLTARR